MSPTDSRKRCHSTISRSKPYAGHSAQIRLRDGCLTCRLRQKKCEQSHRQAACGPCERLKIECLGYSARWPPWLNDQTRRECHRAIRRYLAGRRNDAVPLSLSKFYEPFQWIPTVPPPTFQTSMFVSISPQLDKEASQPTSVHVSSFSALFPPTVKCIPPGSSATEVTDSAVLNDSCSIDTAYNLLGRLTLQESGEGGSDLPTLCTETKLGVLKSDGTSAGSLSVTSHYFHLPPYFRVFHEWGKEVRPFQYRLATFDLDIEDLATTAGSSPMVIEVTQNLTHLHALSHCNFVDVPRQKLLLDAKQARARERLILSSQRDPYHTALALGAAFGLSFMLFRGGTGEWKPYLDVSNAWLSGQRKNILGNTGDFPQLLVTLAEIAIWMDILASASLRRKPVHLDMYRVLLALEWDRPVQIRLAKTMGCDNRTMFGIAEIAALDEWKNAELDCGRLDVLTLIDRAREIDERFFAMQGFVVPYSTTSTQDLATLDPLSPSFDGPLPRPENVIAVFRAGAQVYLNAVVSGSYPDAKNVAHAVDHSILCIQAIPASDADRSLIFPLCITACLVRTEEQKTYFRQRFASLKAIEREGNCYQALLLVEEVWARRDREDPANPVEWWAVMKASGNIILLV